MTTASLPLNRETVSGSSMLDPTTVNRPDALPGFWHNFAPLLITLGTPIRTVEKVPPLSDSTVHCFCAKDPSTSVINVFSQMDDHHTEGRFFLFHVCTLSQLQSIIHRLRMLASAVPLFSSTLSEASLLNDQLSFLAAPYQQAGIPDEMYRHFFLQAAGPATSLDVWLQQGANRR